MIPLPVEESVSESVEFPEGFFRVHHQRVARYDSLLIPVHHRYEGIRGGLWSDPHPWEILLHQVPDEGRFSGGILTDQKHHGLIIEVGILQRRGVEVVEAVGVLQREELMAVQAFQPFGDILKQLRLLFPVSVGPAEHGGYKK